VVDVCCLKHVLQVLHRKQRGIVQAEHPCCCQPACRVLCQQLLVRLGLLAPRCCHKALAGAQLVPPQHSAASACFRALAAAALRV
jgi:hypothetical protein